MTPSFTERSTRPCCWTLLVLSWACSAEPPAGSPSTRNEGAAGSVVDAAAPWPRGGSSAGGQVASGDPAGGGSAGADADRVPLAPSLLASCTGTAPILCALPAPNGNYDVTVELGDDVSEASSLLAAETRHYVAPELRTVAGGRELLTFTVNVRQEQHDGGQSAVAGILDLSISGSAPQLRGLGLRPAPNTITVFVAGDSTVCDWTAANTSAVRDDEAGWAQPLSMYFKQGVAVANYADSGETAADFYTKFFPAARSAMKPGDYLFIQFGHNDQKPENNAAAGYKSNLLKYVNDAREREVIPVLFTPVSRKGGSVASPGFAGLDQEARDLAKAQGIALIDLTLLSLAYYASVPDKHALFVDGGTHLSDVGAIGVAGEVAAAIKASALGLRAFVK